MVKSIRLTQGKHAIVDEEDFAYLNQWNWWISSTGYAYRTIWLGNRKQRNEAMHRLILKSSKGQHTDHINGNRLDNRQKNLRICSNAENRRNSKIRDDNTSGFKGVTWVKRIERWQAQIQMDGKNFFLGYFNDVHKAYDAYCEAAQRLHGEFARLK